MLIRPLGPDFKGKYTNLKGQGANPSFQKALPEYALDTQQAKSFVDTLFNQSHKKTLELLKKAIELLPESIRGLSKEKNESVNFFVKLENAMKTSKKNTLENSVEKLNATEIVGMPANAKFKTMLSIIENDEKLAPFYKALTGGLNKAPEKTVQKELAADVVEIATKPKKTIIKNKAQKNFEQGKKLHVETLQHKLRVKESEVAESQIAIMGYQEQLTEINKAIRNETRKKFKNLKKENIEIVGPKLDEIERNKFLTKIKNLETRTNPSYTKRLERSISELEKKSADLEIHDSRLQNRIIRKKELLASILDGSQQKALGDVKREYAEFSKKNPLAVTEELSEIAEKRLEYKSNIKILKNQTSQEYIKNLETKIAELKKQQAMPAAPNKQIQKELEQNNQLMQRILNGNTANDLETTEVQYKLFSQQNPKDNSSRVKNKRKEYTTKINELKQMLEPSYLESLEAKSAKLKQKLEAPTLPFINLEKQITEKEAFLKQLTDGTKQQELKKLEQEYSEFSEKYPEPKAPKEAIIDIKSNLSNLEHKRSVLIAKIEKEKNRLIDAKKELISIEKEIRVEKNIKKGKERADRQRARSLEAKLGLEATPKKETQAERFARIKQERKLEAEALEYKPTPEQLERQAFLKKQIEKIEEASEAISLEQDEIQFLLYGGNKYAYGLTAKKSLEEYLKKMEAADKIVDATARKIAKQNIVEANIKKTNSYDSVGVTQKLSELKSKLTTASAEEIPALKNEIATVDKEFKDLNQRYDELNTKKWAIIDQVKPLQKEVDAIEFGFKLEEPASKLT